MRFGEGIATNLAWPAGRFFVFVMRIHDEFVGYEMNQDGYFWNGYYT